jgi:hypothetical protein
MMDNARRAKAIANAAGFQFVMTQLDTGFVFCRMASEAKTKADAQRNTANANRSYGFALEHISSLALNREEHDAFDEKKERLRLLLADFGFAF